MSFKIKKPKTITYPKDEDIKFTIRNFSPLFLKTLPSNKSNELSSEIMWEVFNGCILSWEGFEDENNKPLQCNTENKRLVAEQDSDILNFIFVEIMKTKDETISEEEIKN